MSKLSGNQPILASQGQTFFANSTEQPNTSSMLFTMLPAAVRSRLPRIPSMRRSVSMYGLANNPKSHPPKRRSGCGHSSTGTRTPDGNYMTALVLGDAHTVDTNEEMAGYFVESASSDDESTANFRRKINQSMVVAENKSGIGWKFANQGFNLLSLAAEESSTISRDPDLGNASFARQLYIHALTYLLRALPGDLSAEERITVRGALPPGVVEPLHVSNNYLPQSHPPVADQPSILHRALASTIVQFFLLIQFLLPYIKYLLHITYQYDREHKLSAKVISQGIETIDTLSKSGLNLSGAIYGMGDGKVGQMITDSAAWFIEGVTGGVHEGVSKGMGMVGAAPRQFSLPLTTAETR